VPETVKSQSYYEL